MLTRRYYYRRSRHLLFLIFLPIIFLSLHAQDSQIELKVVSEQANIRVAPDIGSTIIHMAPQGSVFTSLGKEGEWYQIRYLPEIGDAITGFVHKSLVLEIIKPSLEKVAKPPEKKAEPVVKPRAPEPKKPEEPPTPPLKKEPVAIEKPPRERGLPPIAPSTSPLREKVLPISLSLFGGVKYVEGGDINTGALGLADFYNASLPGDQVGEVQALHLSYIIGGEVAFTIHPNLTIGIGADYFIAHSESAVSYAGGSTTADLTIRPEMNMLPIRLTLSCYIIPKFYIKSGIEYHLAKCSYLYQFQQGDYWKQYQGEANARGLGILAGFGFVEHFTQNISFFIEAMGRYARVMDFKGKNIFNDSDGLESIEEGFLYIFKSQTSPDTTHSLLFIRDKKPSEAGVSDPQKATIDFSGVSLRAGIMLRF